MVTTRGQQRQSDAKSLSDGLDLYHSLTGLKRKADDEGDGNRLNPANEKRRRYSAEGGPTEHASDDEFKERSQSAGVLNSQERDESQKLAIRSYEGAHLEGESSAAQAVTMTTEAPDFESGSLNISQESWANTKVTQSSSPRPGKSLVPVIYVDKKGFRPEQVDAQQAGEEPVAPELADTESAHTEPIITETVDTGSFSNEPTPVEPIDRSHDHTNTNDAELVDMKPVGTEQVTTESVNIEPTSAGPAKTAPDNFEPVDGDSTIQEPAETDFAVAGSIPLESRHKRFGSEDHVILETQLRETIATVDVNENSTKDELEEKEESSEDEAPETVTAAAGHDQARSVAVEAEKSVKQQVEAKKEKRRKRDVELKRQARAAKEERRERDKRSTATSTKQSGDSLARQILETGNLPDELPYEILAAKRTLKSRIPTPPPELATKQNLKNKRKLLDIDTKPPKDIRIGDTVVRVLQDVNMRLPPKVSKSSMAVREALLQGNRGRGSNVEKRKPMHKSFLRK